MENITDKWLIKGLEGYFFGSDKHLYRKPVKSGRNNYGLIKCKKQAHDRYYINKKLVSEKQLKPLIYLNPDPKVWIKAEEMPF